MRSTVQTDRLSMGSNFEATDAPNDGLQVPKCRKYFHRCIVVRRLHRCSCSRRVCWLWRRPINLHLLLRRLLQIQQNACVLLFSLLKSLGVVYSILLIHTTLKSSIVSPPSVCGDLLCGLRSMYKYRNGTVKHTLLLWMILKECFGRRSISLQVTSRFLLCRIATQPHRRPAVSVCPSSSPLHGAVKSTPTTPYLNIPALSSPGPNSRA